MGFLVGRLMIVAFAEIIQKELSRKLKRKIKKRRNRKGRFRHEI